MSTFVWLGLGNLALAVPLALAAWLSGKLLRRPAVTHGLWVLVLLKLVTPPLGFVPVGVIEERRVAAVDEAIESEVEPAGIVANPMANEEIASEPAPLHPAGIGLEGEGLSPREESVPTPRAPDANAVAAAGPPLAPGPSPQRGEGRPAPDAGLAIGWSLPAYFFPAIGGLWLAGATLSWTRILRSSYRFQRLLKEASAAPAELQARVEQLAAELGVHPPTAVFAPGAVSPLLWVWGRTASLVLPRGLFEQLEPEQQTTLLVHELAHWKRGDHWVRRLECLAGGLYWWCPLAWRAQAGVRQAEEECCDAWVVATVPDSSRAYALALVETVDFLAGARPLLPHLASGLGPFPSLQRRLTMIFRTGTHRRLSFLGLGGLVALGGLMLTWSPGPMTAIAQDEIPRPKKKKDAPRPAPDAERQADPNRDDPVDGVPDRVALQRLRAELQQRQAELELMQLQLQRKSQELQMLMDRARQAEAAGRVDPFKKTPPRGAAGDDEHRPGKTPMGMAPPGPDIERRMDALERKVDILIRELEKMSRNMKGGAGGGMGFGGQAGGGGFGPGMPGAGGGPPGFVPFGPGGPGPGGIGIGPGNGGPTPPTQRRETKEKKIENEIDMDNERGTKQRKNEPGRNDDLPPTPRPGAGNGEGFAPAPVAPRRVETPRNDPGRN